jgi:hypothetical protein
LEKTRWLGQTDTDWSFEILYASLRTSLKGIFGDDIIFSLNFLRKFMLFTEL